MKAFPLRCGEGGEGKGEGVHLLADSEEGKSSVWARWLLLALFMAWLLGEAEGGVCMPISFSRWSCRPQTHKHLSSGRGGRVRKTEVQHSFRAGGRDAGLHLCCLVSRDPRG